MLRSRKIAFVIGMASVNVALSPQLGQLSCLSNMLGTWAFPNESQGTLVSGNPSLAPLFLWHVMALPSIILPRLQLQPGSASHWQPYSVSHLPTGQTACRLTERRASHQQTTKLGHVCSCWCTKSGYYNSEDRHVISALTIGQDTGDQAQHKLCAYVQAPTQQ